MADLYALKNTGNIILIGQLATTLELEEFSTDREYICVNQTNFTGFFVTRETFDDDDVQYCLANYPTCHRLKGIRNFLRNPSQRSFPDFTREVSRLEFLSPFIPTLEAEK